jgi:phosphatidylserine/phosphatidylglycerophosphate/cardiolipin synthase-like enzyme
MQCTGDDYNTSWFGNTIHTKGVILDGTVALLGSNNMNTRSELYNSEVMAFVRDPKFASELNAVFEEDLDGEFAQANGQAPLACGSDLYLFGRPPRTIKLEPVSLAAKVKKLGLTPEILRHFQGEM